VKSYAGLYTVYDDLVSGVDFEGWINYVESLTGHYGYKAESVLDLACGTGNTILPFAKKGYHSIGMDISPGMIAVAREKTIKSGLSVEYHIGDMRSFLLRSQVELVTCFHDGLNYIIDSGDLEKVFKNTFNNLVEGGMFVFDLNAVKWIGESDGRPVVIDEDERTIIYRTEHDTADSLWTVSITCFTREGDLYRKFSETHRERGYPPEYIERMLERAGFMQLAVFDSFSFNPPHEKSRRHFYVARKS